MKKYARLRQESSELDNALYDATPEAFLPDHARAPTASSGGSGGNGFVSALKKLGSFREVSASRRHTDSQRQGSGDNGEPRWIEAQEDAGESARWANGDTASLSGRWGSVSTNDLSLSHSGRLVQEGEPWTAPKPAPMHRQSSLRDDAVAPPEVVANANPNANPAQQNAANISKKGTQGWFAAVKRPLQPRKSTQSSAASDNPSDFCWPAETETNGIDSSLWSSSSFRNAAPTASQSMRYDRLKTIDLVENPSFGDEEGGEGHQKAASMRVGVAHSDAIMAMARAYSEKHGVQQAILECNACGRGLGVVVHGNPGTETSFCQSCRRHATSEWTLPPTQGPSESGKSKRKGMMHFCKKILRMGKKPNKVTA